MMDIDDKELFSSATSDEQIPEVNTEAPEAPQEAKEPAAETPQQDERPRDEHGRFVSQQPAATSQPEPAAGQPQPAKDDDARIPPWRLREMREERDAIHQRYLAMQRQFELLQQQMPKPEPKPAPDLYENPDGFVNHHVRAELTPLEQRLQEAEARMQAQLEYTSRRDAFREHGEETVRAAYEWLAKGIQSREPDVVYAYNRVMASEHPYDAAVQAFKRTSIMQQIQQAGDIDKWVLQRAQELQQQRSRQTSIQQPQGSITKLPPSLRNTPAAARSSADDGDDDVSDAALFRHATR